MLVCYLLDTVWNPKSDLKMDRFILHCSASGAPPIASILVVFKT